MGRQSRAGGEGSMACRMHARSTVVNVCVAVGQLADGRRPDAELAPDWVPAAGAGGRVLLLLACFVHDEYSGRYVLY
jgi:hypothetical protein